MRRVIVLAAVGALFVGGWIGVRDRHGGYGSTHGARVAGFTLQSRLVGRPLHEVLVVPKGGGEGRELLVFLHGRGESPASNLTQPLFEELRVLGRRAPDILLADGGDHSYWHDRSDGAWGSSVLREAIPAALRLTRADPHRVAIGGISMGGFGALDLARLAPGRFCAVGAHSPALWFRGADTAAGAFDDGGDFARHDVLAAARARRIYGVPVWIDVGRDDPFAQADTALAHALAAHGTRVTFHLHAGGHGGWTDRIPQYLRFYSRACA